MTSLSFVLGALALAMALATGALIETIVGCAEVEG